MRKASSSSLGAQDKRLYLTERRAATLPPRPRTRDDLHVIVCVLHHPSVTLVPQQAHRGEAGEPAEQAAAALPHLP